MSIGNVSAVLVHGAWADGSSWSKVIERLKANGIHAVAAPLPLSALHEDVAALDRTLERIDGPVVVAGHAYAGAVIGATRADNVKALVYIAALNWLGINTKRFFGFYIFNDRRTRYAFD